MNTGMHDSVNLGWKLSLVLQGLAPALILHTYENERLPNVQKLINYDKDISRLMTMQLPMGWKGDPNADPNEILGAVMAEASTFTSGLSIAFDLNSINIQGSFISSSVPALVTAGQRGPDVQLKKPGTNELTRLLKETPNIAKFQVVVFSGDPEHTGSNFRLFLVAFEHSGVLQSPRLPVSWLTIPAKSGPSACELLDTMPLGKVFYDDQHTAHARYGVDLKKGGIFVIRPDGWVGTAILLNEKAVGELESYFQGIINT